MKVSGAGKTTAGGRAQRAAASRASAGFRVESGDASRASAPTPPSSGPILDALIALQSAGDTPERDRRAAATRMLDLLDSLRAGLLEGGVRVEDLKGLADFAGAKMADGGSPIAEIHAEIALRARVELAKFGR